MKKEKLHQLLQLFQQGHNSSTETINEILGIIELPHATIDIHRKERTGYPETIFGQGKTTQQILDITTILSQKEQNVLVTRLDEEKGLALKEKFPTGTWNSLGRCFLLTAKEEKLTAGQIGVICAGTSDLPVAEEVMMTLEASGQKGTLFTDIGVAGIHRFFHNLEKIRSHQVLIVIAGMEGALTSVVAGQVNLPVIGGPTSVGYGAHLNGLAPLMGMLNSCAPGVVVSNIDNGYGAAMAALRIVQSHLPIEGNQ